ncbi:MAG: DUF3341 domain-containing protein [Bacteroidales bacterium]|nr:DUF3341 domain-containing protein [Bacteroidales bacterium]
MNRIRIIGVFDDEDKLLGAIRSIREKNIPIADVISPFPIHKVFDELKLKTRLPATAFVSGLFALLITFGFLYWTSVVNYPLVFGGKPQNTLSFVIVIFVMVINITAVSAITLFFLREKKGPGAKPHFEYEGISDDRFIIILEKTDDIDTAEAERIMTAGGALKVDEMEIVEKIKEPF